MRRDLLQRFVIIAESLLTNQVDENSCEKIIIPAMCADELRAFSYIS